MTKTDRTQTNPDIDVDDILTEYDQSKIAFVRGKHAHLVGQPHTVTIHNGDGTATVQKFDGTGNMTSEKHNVWIGDRIAGDKIACDT
jgi:ribosomal protein S4E